MERSRSCTCLLESTESITVPWGWAEGWAFRGAGVGTWTGSSWGTAPLIQSSWRVGSLLSPRR